jgi:hypothetical protein
MTSNINSVAYFYSAREIVEMISKLVLSFLLETLKNESQLLVWKEIFELNSNQMLNITLEI